MEDEDVIQVDEYRLIKTESSFCPRCEKNVELLTSDVDGPMFYICFDCREVRRVGVGLVGRSEQEETRDWRRNGIMVPYGFVLWALRDAMTHPSDATHVLDEFLRKEFDEMGEAFQDEILKVMNTYILPQVIELVAGNRPALREAMERDHEVWYKLLDHLRGGPP